MSSEESFVISPDRLTSIMGYFFSLDVAIDVTQEGQVVFMMREGEKKIVLALNPVEMRRLVDAVMTIGQGVTHEETVESPRNMPQNSQEWFDLMHRFCQASRGHPIVAGYRLTHEIRHQTHFDDIHPNEKERGIICHLEARRGEELIVIKAGEKTGSNEADTFWFKVQINEMPAENCPQNLAEGIYDAVHYTKQNPNTARATIFRLLADVMERG